MLDASCDLCYIDDTVVCHLPAVITGNRDSKVGDYCLEYDIPPFFLNTGKFYFRYWFGLNQHYRIWGDYIHPFEVENEITRDGYMGTPAGLLRPKFEYNSIFVG